MKKLCPFCIPKTKDRQFLETSFSRAIIARDAVDKGQALVIPKRHLESISEITDTELVDLALCCKYAILLLGETYNIINCNVVLNNGVLAGQSVPHLHLHIIPRFEEDTPTPKLWLSEHLFSKLKRKSNSQMIKEANQIKKISRKNLRRFRSNKNLILDSPDSVHISPKAVFLGPVKIGMGCVIEDNVSIGNVASNKDHVMGNNSEVIIGANSIIRSGTIIYHGSQIGENFDCGHYVLIRENTKIGKNVYIYPGTQIHRNVQIGNNCRIAGWIGNNSEIKNNASVFGNLVHKYSTHKSGMKEPAPKICENAMVGWNAIVIGGVTVGKNSIVGAGSIVTKDIPDNATVTGAPAN